MKMLLLAAAAAIALTSPTSAQLYGNVTTTPSGMNKGYKYFNGTIGGRPVGGLVVPGNNGFSAYIGN